MNILDDNTDSNMPNNNLWAPWRIEYLNNIESAQSECFFCDYRDNPEKDESNLVLIRGKRVFSILNRFPYTGGHALVTPYEHAADIDDIDDDTYIELMIMLKQLKAAISRAISPSGFNIGFNLGQCAGAGIPGHLHAHIVPRWPGDTNFMPVIGNISVIPDFLQKTRKKILDAWNA